MLKNHWKKTDERNVLEVKEKAGVTYLSYPLLEHTNCVRHAFSTRLGGVSEGIYASMNLSFSRGDDPEAVRENFRRMAEVLEISPEQYVFSAQTHTTNVREATKNDARNRHLFPEACTTGCPDGYTLSDEVCQPEACVTGCPDGYTLSDGVCQPEACVTGCPVGYTDGYTDVDGLVTNEPGLCLATFYADCVPLFFVDPVRRAIGLSHSGWRGTVGKIGKVTVEKMTKLYGTDPKDVVAAVGPSICQDCYEVSEDVIAQFRENYDEKYWENLFYAKENEKYQLNLWEANRIVLQEAGIPSEQIAVTNICTCCNSELLFSHRASQGKRGNLGAFLVLE